MRGIKITARLCAKNAGGAYVRGGAYLRDTTVYGMTMYSLKVEKILSPYLSECKGRGLVF